MAALENSALPPDPNPAAWRRALRESAGELDGWRWCWWVANALVAALVAVAAVVANDNAWTVWAVALAVAAQAVVVTRPATTKLRTIRRLLAQLDREAEPRRP